MSAVPISLGVIASLVFYFSPYIVIILLSLLLLLLLISQKEDNFFLILFFILIFFNQFRNVDTESTYLIYEYHFLGLNLIEGTIIMFLAIYLLKSALRGEIKISASRFFLNKPILCFGMAMVLASVVGLFFFGASLHRTLGQLRPLSYIIILYFLTIVFIKTKTQLNQILWAILIFTGLRATHGIFLYFFDPARQRMGGSFTFLSHEVTFFMLVLALGFIFISNYPKEDRMIHTWIWIMMPTTFSFLFSFRRGAWLGLGLSFFITFLALPKPVKWKLVKVGVPLLALLLMIMVVVQGLSSLQRLEERLSSVTLTTKNISLAGYGITESNMYRLWETANGLISLKSHPIFGIGLGTEWPVYIPFRGFSLSRFRFHNTWLALWVKIGFWGIFSFIWINWSFFKKGLKLGRIITDRYYKSICLGLLVFVFAVDIALVFGDWIYYFSPACLLGFVFGVMALLERFKERGEIV
ncbi:MAG: O-antigen ligase family protein [Candidatus Zixiibacteriota bacterium]